MAVKKTKVEKEKASDTANTKKLTPAELAIVTAPAGETPEIATATIPNDSLIEKHSNQMDIKEAVQMELSELAGIGKVRQDKLNLVGITTPLDLIIAGPVEVASITEMELDKTNELDKIAREYLQGKNIVKDTFSSATQIMEYRQSVINTSRISTGSSKLDEFFGGGIEPQAITELYGLFGSGKTQFCHTLAVLNQLPKEEGGRHGSVLWFDTEVTFRPERIRDIVIARGLVPLQPKTKKSDPNVPIDMEDVNKFLDRILVAKIHNSSHQALLMNDLSSIIEEEKKSNQEYPITLVIVDGLMSHFRMEYIGRAMLPIRQAKIGKYLKKLMKVAEIYNIAAVITNQVTANPDGFSAPVKAIGGNVLGHISTYRVFLKKSGSKRIARMDDSPMHAQYEVPYLMTDAGIVDVAE